MYTYHQSTGVFEHNGVTLFTGYAGYGAGVNSPGLQGQKSVGPRPQGRYTMIQFVANAGKAGLGTIRLTPNPANQMFGRSGFCIHGGNSDTELFRGSGPPGQRGVPQGTGDYLPVSGGY